MRRLLKQVGLMLLVALWLPVSFTNRACASELSPEGQAKAHVTQSVCAACPHGPAAFQQLRFPGPPTVSSKMSSLHALASLPPVTPLLSVVDGRHFARAAGARLNGWQFEHRAALLPRAPCRG